jgi:hypothetical protein
MTCTVAAETVSNHQNLNAVDLEAVDKVLVPIPLLSLI